MSDRGRCHRRLAHSLLARPLTAGFATYRPAHDVRLDVVPDVVPHVGATDAVAIDALPARSSERGRCFINGPLLACIRVKGFLLASSLQKFPSPRMRVRLVVGGPPGWNGTDWISREETGATDGGHAMDGPSWPIHAASTML